MPTESLPMPSLERPKRRKMRPDAKVNQAKVESESGSDRVISTLELPRAAPVVSESGIVAPEARSSSVVEPALFGATLAGGREVSGGYRRAGVIAVGLHALVIGAALAMPASSEPVKAAPEEPEIVFLQFSPAPAAAGPKLAKVDAVKQAPVVRTKPRPKPRPELAIPAVVPVVEPKVEAAPVEAVVEETATEQVASTDGAGTVDGVEGGQGAGGTATGDGVVPGGTGMGVLGDAAVPARQLAHPPKVLRRVEAAYPRWAERNGIQGRVIVRVIIGSDGRIEQDSVKVMRSIPELDEAALTAARGWRFTPGRTAAGKVVRVIVDIPFQFTLR